MSLTSKYLNQFLKLKQTPIKGNRMIVEVLPKEELKSAGGLVLAASSDYRSSTEENRATLAVVLATGPGYFDDETNEPVDMDYKPGNVVLISEMGIKKYTQFPGLLQYTANDIGITRDVEVHMAWDSIEAYEAYKAVLNS